MSAVDWNAYGDCSLCRALTGEPCLSMVNLTPLKRRHPERGVIQIRNVVFPQHEGFWVEIVERSADQTVDDLKQEARDAISKFGFGGAFRIP